MKVAFSVVLLALSLGLPAGAFEPMPVSRAFSLMASRTPDGSLSLRFTAEPGNYLYRDSLKATRDGQSVALVTPAGEEKDDPNFGQVEVYHGSVSASVEALPPQGEIKVEYRGCAEAGVCYPVVTRTVDLATLAVSGGRRPSLAPASADFAPLTPAPVAQPVPEEEGLSKLVSGSPLVMLGGFLGFGLLLALTPCVFPMIPILSAMLAGAGERLSARRGFVLSATYVVAMAAAYGLVGLAAGWSGANLQAVLQTPWVLGVSALVFVLLSLSMFGLYELRLPHRLTAHHRHRAGGSLIGAAVLGFGSALIVGPCVTPPLAAAMLYAVQTGEAARGGAALFALGLGMGLPLIAVGTFGAKVLPKSGPWMVAVRQAFGLVFLVVATMLATRLMPGAAVLAVWGALAIGASVFLGGFDRLGPASGWKTRLGKASGLVVALYGGALIVGAAGGADDPMRPLAFLGGGAERAEVMAGPVSTRVTSVAGLEQAVQGRRGPSLVSFTADWCTICKSNEKVMDEDAVRARLAAVPVVVADVTGQDAGEQALMSRYAVIGPPTVFLVDVAGREIPGTRITGPLSSEEIFRRFEAAGI